MENIKVEKKECSIVLVGKFNPGMFHPSWFVKNDIMKPEDEVFSEEQSENYPLMVSNQLTMFRTNSLSIKIDINRFQVLSNKEDYIDVIDFVCKTLDVLSAYSITAYGFNFSAHYDLQNQDSFKKFGDLLAPKVYWSEFMGESKNPEKLNGLQSMRMIKFKQNDDGYDTLEIQGSARLKFGVFMASNDHNNVSDEDNDGENVSLMIKEQFENAFEIMANNQLELIDKVMTDGQ